MRFAPALTRFQPSAFSLPRRNTIVVRSYRRRAISDQSPLPPIEEWRQHFPMQSQEGRSRVSVHNKATAATLAKAFLEDKDFHSKTGRVIIEAFPGPGVLSRALLEYPENVVRKLIILEEKSVYLKYHEELAKLDPRVVLVPKSGHEWGTYRHLQETGLLSDVDVEPWGDEMHQGLQFISHIPHSVYGEQLIAQLLRYISERSWLYRYGRLTMNIIMREFVWQRISAAPGGKDRCKLSVVADANSRFTLATSPERLLPPESHFYPYPRLSNTRAREDRKAGQPSLAVTFKPRSDPLIKGKNLDKWDYVLRKMFVLRSAPLRKALPTLAAGAQNLLKSLEVDPSSDRFVDTSKPVRSLTSEEWGRVVQAFEAWPFAPDMLYISETPLPNGRK